MTEGIHKVKTPDGVSTCHLGPSPAGGKKISAAEALEQVASIIRNRAEEIATGAVELAVKGQLPHVKYLFELAGIDGGEKESRLPEQQEEPLTARLLRQLGMPTEPPSEER